ncbi:MAG: hypothetical protein DHS80DRAFT_21399 [Piptocephalis tieghemiana]|nr:MAG: hypothetical protein DHS80DRAFT_21399 [Piptocephalis tieghemiana]
MPPSNGSLAAPRPNSMLAPSYTDSASSSISSSPASSTSMLKMTKKHKTSDSIPRPYSVGYLPTPVEESSMMDYHAILSELSDPSPRPRDSLIPYREAPKEMELLQDSNKKSSGDSKGAKGKGKEGISEGRLSRLRAWSRSSSKSFSGHLSAPPSEGHDADEEEEEERPRISPGRDYQRHGEQIEERKKAHHDPPSSSSSSSSKTHHDDMSVAVGVAIRTAVSSPTHPLRIIHRVPNPKRASASVSSGRVSPSSPSRSLSSPTYPNALPGRAQSVLLPDHIADHLPNRSSLSISSLVTVPTMETIVSTSASSSSSSPASIASRHLPSSGSSQYSTPMDTPSVMVSSPTESIHPSDSSPDPEEAYFFKEISIEGEDEEGKEVMDSDGFESPEGDIEDDDAASTSSEGERNEKMLKRLSSASGTSLGGQSNRHFTPITTGALEAFPVPPLPLNLSQEETLEESDTFNMTEAPAARAIPRRIRRRSGFRPGSVHIRSTDLERMGLAEEEEEEEEKEGVDITEDDIPSSSSKGPHAFPTSSPTTTTSTTSTTTVTTALITTTTTTTTISPPSPPSSSNSSTSSLTLTVQARHSEGSDPGVSVENGKKEALEALGGGSNPSSSDATRSPPHTTTPVNLGRGFGRVIAAAVAAEDADALRRRRRQSELVSPELSPKSRVQGGRALSPRHERSQSTGNASPPGPSIHIQNVEKVWDQKEEGSSSTLQRTSTNMKKKKDEEEGREEGESRVDGELGEVPFRPGIRRVRNKARGWKAVSAVLSSATMAALQGELDGTGDLKASREPRTSSSPLHVDHGLRRTQTARLPKDPSDQERREDEDEGEGRGGHEEDERRLVLAWERREKLTRELRALEEEVSAVEERIKSSSPLREGGAGTGRRKEQGKDKRVSMAEKAMAKRSSRRKSKQQQKRQQRMLSSSKDPSSNGTENPPVPDLPNDASTSVATIDTSPPGSEEEKDQKTKPRVPFREKRRPPPIDTTLKPVPRRVRKAKAAAAAAAVAAEKEERSRRHDDRAEVQEKSKEKVQRKSKERAQEEPKRRSQAKSREGTQGKSKESSKEGIQGKSKETSPIKQSSSTVATNGSSFTHATKPMPPKVKGLQEDASSTISSRQSIDSTKSQSSQSKASFSTSLSEKNKGRKPPPPIPASKDQGDGVDGAGGGDNAKVEQMANALSNLGFGMKLPMQVVAPSAPLRTSGMISRDPSLRNQGTYGKVPLFPERTPVLPYALPSAAPDTRSSDRPSMDGREDSVAEGRLTTEMERDAARAAADSALAVVGDGSPVFSGRLYKLGGNGRWQKREFRFDGTHLVCLRPKSIRVAAHSIRMLRPSEAADPSVGFYGTQPPLPKINHPLLATPEGPTPPRGKPGALRQWVKFYQAPKWVIPITEIKEVSLLTRKGIKVRECFCIRTPEREHVMRGSGKRDLASWLFLLRRMVGVVEELEMAAQVRNSEASEDSPDSSESDVERQRQRTERHLQGLVTARQSRSLNVPSIPENASTSDVSSTTAEKSKELRPNLEARWRKSVTDLVGMDPAMGRQLTQ